MAARHVHTHTRYGKMGWYGNVIGITGKKFCCVPGDWSVEVKLWEPIRRAACQIRSGPFQLPGRGGGSQNLPLYRRNGKLGFIQ